MQFCAACCKAGGTDSGNLKSCSSCHEVQYCSRECQRKHWKVHKPHCQHRASTKTQTNDRHIAHEEVIAQADRVIQRLHGELKELEAQLRRLGPANKAEQAALREKASDLCLKCAMDTANVLTKLPLKVREAQPRTFRLL
jgi:hypothetical protein